jgi:ATP-dependent DNA helicase 2 subunit 1
MLKKPAPSGDKKADTDSAAFAALKCAYKVMQQRIISSPKDMMGVLLFGTEKTKFQEDANGQQRSQAYPNMYLFNDLNVPDAEDVKSLKQLVEEGEDPEGILTPSDNPVSISNLIHAAIYLFTTNCPSFGSRRLFIITDNDSPHGDDKEEKSYAAVQAKDLFDIDARIELFPISRGDKKFDLTKFYDVRIHTLPSRGTIIDR